MALEEERGRHAWSSPYSRNHESSRRKRLVRTHVEMERQYLSSQFEETGAAAYCSVSSSLVIDCHHQFQERHPKRPRTCNTMNVYSSSTHRNNASIPVTHTYLFGQTQASSSFQLAPVTTVPPSSRQAQPMSMHQSHPDSYSMSKTASTVSVNNKSYEENGSKAFYESHFELQEQLGQGHFGKVYRATTSMKHTNTPYDGSPFSVALKRFSKSNLVKASKRGRLVELLKREIAIHRRYVSLNQFTHKICGQ